MRVPPLATALVALTVLAPVPAAARPRPLDARGDARAAAEARVVALCETARSRREHGRLSSARHALEEARDLAPDDPRVLAESAALALASDHPAAARRDAEGALAAGAGGDAAITAHRVLATLLARQDGDPEKALDHLAAAARLAEGETLAEVRAERAVLLHRLGRDSEARAEADAALHATHDDRLRDRLTHEGLGPAHERADQ